MCSALQANYTFYFVDKIKVLSETFLKISKLFQGSGNGQMFNQLQVCDGCSDLGQELPPTIWLRYGGIPMENLTSLKHAWVLQLT